MKSALPLAGLTAGLAALFWLRMLQHNTQATAVLAGGQRAHVAHAAMISLHALCCGLPILALMLTALSGAAAGTTLLLTTSREVHAALHTHELWILAVSVVLVTVGGLFEVAAIRAGLRRWISPLFLLSLACFAFNVAILAVHRA